jgi:hypothetical protein
MLDVLTAGLAGRREIPEFAPLPIIENVIYCPELSVEERRNSLAAWLDLEANVVQATAPGTEERRRVRVVSIASRPNDNEHIATARRIAKLLRDSAMPLEVIEQRVKKAHHFRASFKRFLAALIRPDELAALQRTYRKQYEDSLPLPYEGEPDHEVERIGAGVADKPRRGPDGPPVEQVIDVSDPAWMIAGADEPTEQIRTAEGTFDVPVSAILRYRAVPMEVATA